MGRTYIFFEPKDKIFFEKIADIYCKLIEKYYQDAEKAYSVGDNFTFFKNYENTLIFPSCDYNALLLCPRTVCGPDKCPALTEDQKDLISSSLKYVIGKLRGVSGINNVIVDKIYNNSFFLLSKRTEPLLFRYKNSLALYLQLMRGISGRPDAEKLIYVCSENSKYDYFMKEMSKPALEKCTYYQ